MTTKQLAALYAIEESSLCRVASGFQNTTYKFERDGHTYILRAASCARRDLPLVQGELDWLQFLGKHGLPVSLPIPNVDGHLATEVELQNGKAIVSAFTYAPGTLVNVQDPEQWNAAFYKNWGALVGKMHAVSREYTPSSPAIRRPDWNRQDPVLQEIKRHFADTDAALSAKCEQWLATIASLPRTSDTYGLIHNDFHQGNFHLHHGEITVFDFDDCQYSWFANDIATPFYHAYWQSTWSQPDIKKFAEEFMHNFLAGYSQEHTLHPDIVRQIPIFLKWREIFLLYLFQTRWDPNHLVDWQAHKLQELKHCILHDIPYSHLNFANLY